MKKLTVIGITFLLFNSNKIICQTINIVPAQSEINYLLKETKKNSTVSQSVEVQVEYKSPKPGADYAVTFGITNPTPGVSSLGINPRITNVPVGGYVINDGDFKSKPDTAKFIVNIEIDATDRLTGAEYFDIKITGARAGTSVHRVLISTVSTEAAAQKKKEKEENPLETGAVSIGHSFDFFGKSNALISYADAFIFKPNSIRIGENATSFKYGFAIKIYQNKSITLDSLNSSGVPYKLISQNLLNPFQPPVNDSVLLKQEVLNRKASYTSSNWGMCLRLFRDISHKNEKVKFYLGIHGEFLRRDIKTYYEYKTEKDTVIKVKTSELSFPNVTPFEKNTVQSEFYCAPYVEFVFVDNNVKTHFSLIPAGLHLYKSSLSSNITKTKCFFLGQFDLIIRKINLKVGAECRGLFSDRNQPYWNVFISKAFSWDKIADLLFDK